VLHIPFKVVGHSLYVKKKNRDFLKDVFFTFNFIFFLKNEDYVISSDTIVTGILDMRPGKHDLHFLVGDKLPPHAIVKIPDEKMHIGVFLFIFIIYSLLFFKYILNYMYLFYS
jgi:hypothetical protein